MDCIELDDESHDILQRLSHANVSKEGWVKKLTFSALMAQQQLTRAYLAGLVADLEASGFVERQDNHLKLLQPCGCAAPTMLDSGDAGGYSRGHASGHAPPPGSTQGEIPYPYYVGDRKPPPSFRSSRGNYFGKPQDSAPNQGESGQYPKRLGGRTPRRRVRRREPEIETPAQLALAFDRSLRKMRRENPSLVWVGGGTNVKALIRHITEWQQEGTSPAEIREMITLFCDSPGWLRQGTAPWRIFVSSATELLQRVRNSGPPPGADDWLSSEPLDRAQRQWGQDED